jgi:MinD-like ATPase involved in chromosome partitioning or flagellar assembly
MTFQLEIPPNPATHPKVFRSTLRWPNTTFTYSSIPLVPNVRESGDDGIPVTVSAPESKVSRVYDNQAAAIEQMDPERVYKSELKVMTGT